MKKWLQQIARRIEKNWYQSFNFLTLLLLPFSFLFYLIIAVRKYLYHKGLLTIHTFDVPIIVVGNITVGGTGKTPLVIYLANLLTTEGYHVGIVSRGYKSKKLAEPLFVTSESDVNEVGDEPLLIANHVPGPVVVFPDRVKAVETLLRYHMCNVVICDDGLQHYALGRNIEIAVIDGDRRLGNERLLPAGPLREPIRRLKTVDFVVCNGQCDWPGSYPMLLTPGKITSVMDEMKQTTGDEIKNKIIHAVVGIGNPKRFFETLKNLKLRFFDHVFPDHYPYKKKDFEFGEENIVIMTEKDAVKCRVFADERFWFLPVTAILENEFGDTLLTMLASFSESGELDQKRGISYED